VPRTRKTDKQADIERLIERAERGDESALPALRESLEPEVWQQVGNLAMQARAALTRALSGDSVFIREAVNQRLRDMREELELPTDGELERLLLDQVRSSWLALHHAEAVRNQSLGTGLTIPQAEFNERRVTQCQKRYLAAIKTLAQVRRLMRPFIQVNIAEKQTNLTLNR
jgi:hypothetical protein